MTPKFTILEATKGSKVLYLIGADPGESVRALDDFQIALGALAKRKQALREHRLDQIRAARVYQLVEAAGELQPICRRFGYDSHVQLFFRMAYLGLARSFDYISEALDIPEEKLMELMLWLERELGIADEDGN